jgi:hypothetical protein
MVEAKKNNGIVINYTIRKIEASEEKKIILVLEPVEKQKIPGNPLGTLGDLSSLMGLDEEDIAKGKKLAEGMMDQMMQCASLYQITITPEQLKKLNKTIGDKVTVTVQ